MGIIKQVKNIFNKDSEKMHKLHIRDLVMYITEYQQNKKKTKTLLGLTFNFYEINIGSITLELETKGRNDDYVLELLVLENEEEIFSYRSYEEGQSLKDKYAIPYTVYNQLIQ
ncbi:hypothetical protein QA612_19235 [Evansella sp. AB-P1]|uniref:hypothetical protein n=1 Tax=Evansella sp. AB-P1 TaxID=3037653 RepID=UPI00241FBFA9|nr:hypothetical protein [Evansella sp. AB-P1]MDG5789597.1 hypothetical protein [Evansella sp. AB-P1]